MAFANGIKLHGAASGSKRPCRALGGSAGVSLSIHLFPPVVVVVVTAIEMRIVKKDNRFGVVARYR